MTEVVKAKSMRGFASMSIERRQEIARLGGMAVPNEKRSFSVNRELAVEAGRRGGKSVDPRNRSFSKDRELAVVAGRRGGSSK